MYAEQNLCNIRDGYTITKNEICKLLFSIYTD